METKTYKHKTNGSTMTYRDGCMKIENLVIEGHPNLEYWDEVIKQCIYVTVDNVEIFGGESIYGVTDDFQLTYTSIATKENVKEVRVFSTKESAEKYIRENKPQYSLKDIKDTVEKLGCFGTTLIEYLEKNGRTLE